MKAHTMGCIRASPVHWFPCLQATLLLIVNYPTFAACNTLLLAVHMPTLPAYA